MKQGILIVTWSGGKEQFTTLWNSFPKPCKYPILVVVNDGTNASWITEFDVPCIRVPYDGFELGAMKIVLKFTDWDEFIVLQDTIEILDPAIFDILFSNYPDKSVGYGFKFQSYLGKFRRVALEKMEIPEVHNKVISIAYETSFIDEYLKIEPTVIFNEGFADAQGYQEERWGRPNLVLKDRYLIKRKGTWLPEHVNKLAEDSNVPFKYAIGEV
jgi:hypothetical protein